MTEKGFITANSGDTDVAGTLSIAAPRALYAVASGHKPKKNPEELLPASPADRGSGIRLIKSEDRKKDDIINRPGRSTYPREKSVLTSGATCTTDWRARRGRTAHRVRREGTATAVPYPYPLTLRRRSRRAALRHSNVRMPRWSGLREQRQHPGYAAALRLKFTRSAFLFHSDGGRFDPQVGSHDWKPAAGRRIGRPRRGAIPRRRTGCDSAASRRGTGCRVRDCAQRRGRRDCEQSRAAGRGRLGAPRRRRTGTRSCARPRWRSVPPAGVSFLSGRATRSRGLASSASQRLCILVTSS